MEHVSALNGIKYGFSIMGYLFVVVFVGAAISAIGFFLVVDTLDTTAQQPDLPILVVGLTLWICGGFTAIAGLLGMIYKVIVDGVATAFQEVT